MILSKKLFFVVFLGVYACLLCYSGFFMTQENSKVTVRIT